MGIILNQKNEVLIAKRPAHKYCSGLWEFPGGKVEQNEDTFIALQRELREELGIEVVSAHQWLKIKHEYSDRTVLLDSWLVKEFTNHLHGAEGQEVRWVSVTELSQYQFPEGNKEIIKKLHL